MPFNALLLPLLGAFVLMHMCNRWYYQTVRLDGYRLLFHTSIAAVFLLLLAQILIFLFDPPLHFLNTLWHQVVPYPGVGAPAIAFLLGALGWLPLNLIFKAKEENDRAAQDNGEPLELLLRRAISTTKPIMLTVKNGKVYVGFVTHNSSPAVASETVKILPMVSGYRNKDDMRVKFTTDYSDIFDKIMAKDESVAHVTADDFEIVIPVREIESVHLFDALIYKMFFSGLASPTQAGLKLLSEPPSDKNSLSKQKTESPAAGQLRVFGQKPTLPNKLRGAVSD